MSDQEQSERVSTSRFADPDTFRPTVVRTADEDHQEKNPMSDTARTSENHTEHPDHPINPDLLATEHIVIHTDAGDRSEHGRTLRSLACINRIDRLIDRLPEAGTINPEMVAVVATNLAILDTKLHRLRLAYDGADEALAEAERGEDI